MTYDEFKEMLLDAGWTIDEIEERWSDYDPDVSSGCGSGDTWDPQDWERE
jgi:hypothetical protein